ncbi:MAG: diaminopimelate dehydrogenase [Clostridia bacterium]|nr:diaminopimelate dehydrogenase [Clostridia bacterium]
MKKSKYLYLLIVPVYLVYFFIAERIVTEGDFISYIPLDDSIPFVEAFVIPYVLWYPLIFGVGIALLLTDDDGFKRYMLFVGISFFSILTLNIIFPNAQELRPDPLPRHNFFTEIIELIYKADTNTNVIPSMHVVGAIGATVAVFYSKSFNRWWRTGVMALSVLTTLSTVLIKQHSVLDVITALPYGAVVALICFKAKKNTTLFERSKNKVMKKIAIVGYGNLGRGVEAVVQKRKDMELVAVVTRRSPESVKTVTGVKAIAMSDIASLKGVVDAVIICGGSATDLPEMTPALARDFNVIDSFDTHAKIPEHFAKVDKASREGGNISMISVGWDPGMFSVNRLYASSILPDGKDYTFWGRGVSQGHSDAIRRIEGVIDARQYTVPIESAVERAKSGENPELTTREKHLRECWVVAEEGADLKRIENEIKNMPNYFADYDTTVNFITLEELYRDHKGLPHGGTVIRTGKTGFDSEHNHTIQYSLNLDSNPEFTASVIVAYTHAMLKMKDRGEVGCKTVFDVAPADLSVVSREEMLAHML